MDQADAGVVFPLVDGRRGTSVTGQAVVADAARVVDLGLAASIARSPARDWRREYVGALRGQTEATLAGADAAYAVASAGLESVHSRFRFSRGGEDLALADAFNAGGPPLVATSVAGTQAGGPRELSVPYRGRRLSGDALRRRLDAWVADGVAEPSFAAALERVARQPDWLDLRDLTVVVLGAAAELGPYVPLVRWGAHVVAVDLPGPAWSRLLGEARHSPGRLTALGSADQLGVDLLTQAPSLLAWLGELDGPFTVGQYVYADGATHVRTSIAVDALIAALLRSRSDLSLAGLATPTDAFLVPEEAVEDSRRRAAAAPAWIGAVRAAGAGRVFRANYRRLHALPDGRLVGLHDSLVRQQGPNYALAKRVQRWRAELARRDGVRVSYTVAPATRTRSVTRNRLLAAGYAGAHRFGIEVFDPSTANTVMAAILVHDLRQAALAASSRLGHPAELLWDGACHGGLWRAPWQARSVLGFAVALGMLPRGR